MSKHYKINHIVVLPDNLTGDSAGIPGNVTPCVEIEGEEFTRAPLDVTCTDADVVKAFADATALYAARLAGSKAATVKAGAERFDVPQRDEK